MIVQPHSFIVLLQHTTFTSALTADTMSSVNFMAAVLRIFMVSTSTYAQDLRE